VNTTGANQFDHDAKLDRAAGPMGSRAICISQKPQPGAASDLEIKAFWWRRGELNRPQGRERSDAEEQDPLMKLGDSAPSDDKSIVPKDSQKDTSKP
jgi:hypothetical protein